MPMSEDFKKRVFPLLPKILADFQPNNLYGRDVRDLSATLSPAFHLFDETGFRERLRYMKKLFFTRHQGCEFFAVKAYPNLAILQIVKEEGFGVDCASPTELIRAQLVGFPPDKIMYTSNNTNPAFYPAILASGVILNLDDLSFVVKLPWMPARICFRYNPGERRTEGAEKTIGDPPNQKYGLRHDQIVEGFRQAKQRLATIFGIHTMYSSNCREPHVLAGNARMLLEVVAEVQAALDIQFKFVNIGGGIGIEYRYDEPALDIELTARLINEELDQFKARNGYAPALYIESGRWVAGPFGILVGRVINVMNKHKKFIGVDFCDMADIFRACFYPKYHEISILTPEGIEKTVADGGEVVSVVGPLCENVHLASDRYLPLIKEGDIVVVHDTGAHGPAMKSNYNGWTGSQHLLLRPDNSVVRISRAEEVRDLLVQELDMVGYEKIVQY